VLDDTKAPVRELLHIAHGVAGVDLWTVLALDVPKTERAVDAPTDQPATRHSASGISCPYTLAALREMEARLAADDASAGCAAYEHRESVEVYHAVSMVGLTPEFSYKRSWLQR
jgi:hypothetical protein